MKTKIALLAALLSACSAFAANPGDFLQFVRDPSNSLNAAFWETPYTSVVNIRGTDTSGAPIMYQMSSDFQINSGQLQLGSQWATNTAVGAAIAAAIPARSFNNAPGRSVVTTAAAANGIQISSSRDAQVSYSVTTSTTSTIAGASTATVVLEICSTNSSTAGNWIEVARTTNNTSVSLAVALQLVNVQASTLSAIVPAGYYSRVRQILTGTSSSSISSGQEVLL